MSLPKVLQKIINNVGYGQALTGNDNDIVHKDSHEEIHGRKLFVSHQTYDSETGWDLASRFMLKTEDITRGVPVSDSKYLSVDFQDSTYDVANDQGNQNPKLASVEYQYYADGAYVLKLLTVDHSDLTNAASFCVGFDSNGIKFAVAPSTSSQRNSGTDIVTRDWIPNDTRIVHTTGNETINDLKTFNQYVTVNRGYSSFVAKNPELTFGQNPSEDKTNILRFITSDGRDYGGCQSIYRQNGETLTRISSERSDGGEGSLLEVNNPATGAPYALCPSTPDPIPENLNGRTFNKTGNTDILTRDWIPRDTRIVHTTGDEEIGGNKTFTSEIRSKKTGTMWRIYNTGLTKGTPPSSSMNYWIPFGDTDGNPLGSIECMVWNTASTGATFFRIYAFKNVANSNDSIHVEVGSGDGAQTDCFFRPSNTDLLSLGTGGRRWKDVYAKNTAIQTSDARLKTEPIEFSDKILDAWDEVNFIQFQFLDAVEKKGSDGARIHNGLIAQNIESIFAKHGIDARKYGFFCFDSWDKIPAEFDEEGNIRNQEIPAGNQYSLRYEEALCMEAAYNRRRVSRLEEKIKLLEQKLNLAS